MPRILLQALAATSLLTTALSNPLLLGLDRRQTDSATCTGQSCVIAAISGSSGQPIDPNNPPEGDTVKGDCCVVSYRPEIRDIAEEFRPELKTRCATSTVPIPTYTAAADPGVKCSAYTLVFAKGTLESGVLGNTVGPKLSQGLTAAAPGKWNVMGVDYDNSAANDFCLGLPGGMTGKVQLEKLAIDCPDTKIIFSGYSQGALVVHNAMGYSYAGKEVTGAVVFGDPMNGAPIKGYSGPIRTYCDPDDGVCNGTFAISGAHLSYNRKSVGNVNDAVTWISNLVAK